MAYSEYFNKFPKLKYDINKSQYPRYETVTDIFFRLGYIKQALGNISSYYVVEIEDGETPEILADKIYGDSNAGWMILLANNITDAQWEWPLDYGQFERYIVGKYGSSENAKTGIHHYDKVIQRTDNKTGEMHETRFQVNEEKLTTNNMDTPYDTYQNLPLTQSIEIIEMKDNTGYSKTVVEKIFKEAISFYDWENEENEKKRLIKIVKKEYYDLIQKEFRELANVPEPFMRKLV